MEDKVKELLDRARFTASLAAESAAKAAEVAAQRGGQLVEKTRRSLQILDLNNQADVLMRDIGRLVYQAHTGAEAEESALVAKLEDLDKLYEQVARLKARQEEQSPTRVCPMCGKTCEKTDLYCRVCGEKL